MTNYTESECPDLAVNFTWSFNLTLFPELQDCNWSMATPSTVASSSGSKRRHGQPHLVMSWWQQLVWTTIFALMLVVAIGGNAIVMWIVLAHRRMRTVTNYFLVNLSVADLFMSTFNCIFNFVYMLNSDWYFGKPYCRVSNFIANVSVAASVFTLTGISLDRYLAIVKPLQPRMSKVSAQVIIVIIWLASMTLGSPCLLYSTTITYRYSGKIRTACILVWPDGQPMVSMLDYVYNVILLLVTYVVPMCAMVACYTAMGRELWGSRSIGELTQRQIDSIRSKRKVVRMFIIIVTIFAVCWLPYHAYFIYTYHNRSLTYSKYVQHLYLGFYWLAMSNAMVNPLIYYWMNARFRQYFKDAVCEWHCPLRKSAHMNGAETPPMFHRYSPPSYSRSRSDEKRIREQRIRRKKQYDVASGTPLLFYDSISLTPSLRRNWRRLLCRCPPSDGKKPSDYHGAMLLHRPAPLSPASSPPYIAKQELAARPLPSYYQRHSLPGAERSVLLPNKLLLYSHFLRKYSTSACAQLAQKSIHNPD